MRPKRWMIGSTTPGRAEIERPRRLRVRRAVAPIGRDDVAVGRRRHPDDRAAQLIEHRELADAAADELELLAVFARQHVLDHGMLEDEFLEPGVEKQGHRDSLIGVRAEQRQRRSHDPVALQQIGGGGAETLERVAERLEIAAQVAGDERAQLPQIGADELLGEDEHVVLKEPEELQRALLVAVEDRPGFRRDLRHLLARVGGPLREDAVLERVALRAAGLHVDLADAPRNRRELPGQIEGMGEPEDRVIVAEKVRHHRVLGDLHQLRQVRGERDVRFLFRRGARETCHDTSSVSHLSSLASSSLSDGRFSQRETERGRLRFVQPENLVRMGEDRVGAREEIFQRPAQVGREEERRCVAPLRQVSDQAIGHLKGEEL